MTKLERITLLLSVIFASFYPRLTQAQKSGPSQLTLLLFKQIQYPIEAVRAKKEGVVLVSLSTDELGNIQEINLEGKANPYFDDQVLKAVASIKELWNPEMLGDRKAGNTYLLVFNFLRVEKGNTKESELKSAINLINKGKPEKALKIADQLVTKNPYDPKCLELRSQINRQLGQEEKATADLLAYQKLQTEVLTQIDIKLFSQVTRGSIIGNSY